MKKRMIAFVLVSVLAGLNCSSHRLHEYKLEDTTVAARTFPPPRANVYTNFVVHFDLSNPVGTALSLGSTIAKRLYRDYQKSREKASSTNRE